MSYQPPQRVQIVGGTFALGLFLAALVINACGINQKLGHIQDALERAHPKVTAK